MEDRQPRNRRQFTAEFKRDAVELVRTTGRPIAEIARELGICDSTLAVLAVAAIIDNQGALVSYAVVASPIR
jgi:transposase